MFVVSVPQTSIECRFQIRLLCALRTGDRSFKLPSRHGNVETIQTKRWSQNGPSGWQHVRTLLQQVCMQSRQGKKRGPLKKNYGMNSATAHTDVSKLPCSGVNSFKYNPKLVQDLLVSTTSALIY